MSTYKFLDPTGLAYFWGKIKSKIAAVTRNDLATIETLNYSGIYGSANDQAGASFYFASVRPTDFNVCWRVRYRVTASVNGQANYKQWSEVEWYGSQTGVNYKIFNRLYSTSYRCYMYHNIYRLKSEGFTAGYGHVLGVGIRASTNPTSSSYPRDIKIEILETENCTITTIDQMKKVAELPGYGSTNYDAVTEANGGDAGLQETGDANTIHQLRHNNGTYIAATALYRYQICFSKNETTLLPANAVNNSTATTKTLTTESFNPFGEILYYNTTTTISADAAIASSSLFQQINVDLRYSFNAGTSLTNNKDVFLKVSPQSDGLVKLDTTSPIVQALPTTEDGKLYILLGHASSTYQMELYVKHPIYEYKDGKLREWTNTFVPTKTSELTNDSNFAVDSSYVHTDNNYTTTEKNKLAGIASGAEVNVNADWNASSGDAQILNKPTIPTKVSDLTNDSGFTSNTGTITGITMNGASKGTSGVVNLGTVITDISGKQDALISGTNIKTVNNNSLLGNGNIDISGGVTTVDPTTPVSGTIVIPTKTSDLTNDSNFIADSNYIHTDNNFTTTLKNKLDGIATGAEVNKIETIKVNGTTQSITNKAVDITVPTNTNQLTNGAGFITSSSLTDYVGKSGATMTGALIAQNNTNYTTAQVRNVVFSTSEPTSSQGGNGDIWIVYS